MPQRSHILTFLRHAAPDRSEAMPFLKKADDGGIIMIGSAAGGRPMGSSIPYSPLEHPENSAECGGDAYHPKGARWFKAMSIHVSIVTEA